MRADPYETLGVEPTATADDLKRAFRDLARRYHPDRNPDDPRAEEQFKRAQEAYSLLNDPQRRAEYDAGTFEGANRLGAQTGFQEVFQDMFGGGAQLGQKAAADVFLDAELSTDEAQKGTTLMLSEPSQLGRKRYKVNIPAGVKDGDQVRLAGRGQAGVDGDSGDLYVTLRVGS